MIVAASVTKLCETAVFHSLHEIRIARIIHSYIATTRAVFFHVPGLDCLRRFRGNPVRSLHLKERVDDFFPIRLRKPVLAVVGTETPSIFRESHRPWSLGP